MQRRSRSIPKVFLGLELLNSITGLPRGMGASITITRLQSFTARLTEEVPDGVEILGYFVVAAACLYCSYLAYRYCCETYICNRLRSLEAQESESRGTSFGDFRARAPLIRECGWKCRRKVAIGAAKFSDENPIKAQNAKWIKHACRPRE